MRSVLNWSALLPSSLRLWEEVAPEIPVGDDQTGELTHRLLHWCLIRKRGCELTGGASVTPNDDGVFRARIDGPVPSVATDGSVTPNDDGVFQARIDGPVPSVVTDGSVTPNDGGVLQARIDGPVPSVVTDGSVTPNDGGVLQARIDGPVPSVATDGSVTPNDGQAAGFSR